jgi:hypothetical protein
MEVVLSYIKAFPPSLRGRLREVLFIAGPRPACFALQTWGSEGSDFDDGRHQNQSI